MITFEITDQQQTEATEWATEHDKTCPYGDPMKQGAIGGSLTWKFTPTTIGIMASLCCACGGSVFLGES